MFKFVIFEKYKNHIEKNLNGARQNKNMNIFIYKSILIISTFEFK